MKATSGARHSARALLKKVQRTLAVVFIPLVMQREHEDGYGGEAQAWRTVLAIATGAALNAGLDEETLVLAVRGAAKGWRDGQWGAPDGTRADAGDGN